MTYNHHSWKAYISADGSYSASENTITFDGDLLTDKQWEVVSELPDSERIIYALAVFDGEDVSEWENE
jgi:AAA+ superfamily predicted ATPase